VRNTTKKVVRICDANKVRWRSAEAGHLVQSTPPTLLKKKLPTMFNNLSGDRRYAVSLTTDNNNREAKKKKREDTQKEDTLQPITKANSKLGKELQVIIFILQVSSKKDSKRN
jgi:hypothetical protein